MPASAQPLSGKVALVTGSTRGMGREVALELASRGADLVINYNSSATRAETVVQEIKALNRKAIAIKADVSKPEQIVAMFDEAMKSYDHLDIVVSNSGIEHFGNVLDIKPEDFDRVFNINTRGQFFVGQQAYKHLSVGGKLVLFSSISAQAKAVKHHALYAASKNAVQAFARCFACDFGDKKITVNAVCPGGVKTDMAAEVARFYMPRGDNMNDEQVEEALAASSPLNKIGMPDDIARVVAFLVGPDGTWVNGESIVISGGAPVA
ncbi:MAG: hypothetical protein M1834_006677 [Cirrosporium novae-zelandiae]|nr:MAG: hypothetical protein M1834_006677 [Cirrosporium novae-zelandiae]